jgi:hypothetical protein
MMDERQIERFVDVIESGSLSRTARRAEHLAAGA